MWPAHPPPPPPTTRDLRASCHDEVGKHKTSKNTQHGRLFSHLQPDISTDQQDGPPNGEHNIHRCTRIPGCRDVNSSGTVSLNSFEGDQCLRSPLGHPETSMSATSKEGSHAFHTVCALFIARFGDMLLFWGGGGGEGVAHVFTFFNEAVEQKHP